MKSFLGHSEQRVAPILGSLRSTAVPEVGRKAARAVLPFVTISRQAGAGGRSLAQALCQKLNEVNPGERPWEIFDHEMLAQLAADERISAELIGSLEEASHSWLNDFLAGLSHRDNGPMDEWKVLHRLAATVRALAQAGRVVMVGCGAGYMTHDMPGGIHVRLVAELRHRIVTVSRLYNTNLDEAARKVQELDRNRHNFYKRYWPDRPLSVEQFTLTLNSSALSEAQMVACLLPLIEEKRLIIEQPLPVADVARPE